MGSGTGPLIAAVHLLSIIWLLLLMMIVVVVLSRS